MFHNFVQGAPVQGDLVRVWLTPNQTDCPALIVIRCGAVSPHFKLGLAPRDFQFIIQMIDFRDCRIWRLAGYDSMENTSTGRGSDLPSILDFFRNDPT